MESAITIKGQITIPKASALRGMLKATRHVSLEQMDEAIATGVSERYRRATRR